MKISVVIPVYQGEEYIAQTIRSICKQTVLPYEVILVDDACTDGSINVAVKEAESHGLLIKTVKHHANCGIGKARQDGVLASLGDYVAFLSADDCWAPSFLEKTSALLEDNVAVFTDYYRCNHALKPFILYRAPQENLRSEMIAFAMKRNIFVNFSSVVMPLGLFLKCGFQPDLRYGEDLILLLDSLLAGVTWAHVNEPLVYYRIHSRQGTHNLTIDKWLLMWKYLRERLLLFGIAEEIINKNMMIDYERAYPSLSLKKSTRIFLGKLARSNYELCSLVELMRRSLPRRCASILSI